MATDIKLSVIIASYNARKDIVNCLESLENQTTDKSFETIVVDSSTDSTAKLIEERFPMVELHRFSERKFPGDARNFGVSVANGEVIAFVDTDCTAASDWVNEILNAHQSQHLAIGGAIANGNCDSYTGWAAYFCEFSQWMPKTESKWMDDIAAANMSYKKNVFDRYGSFIEGTYCSDTDLHWRLGKDDKRLRFVPSIRVKHYSIDNLVQFLRHEVFHGLCFARVRVRSQNFSLLKRLVYVILSPLIPIRLFGKVCKNNIRNRVYLPQFLMSFPLVMMGLICWSFGEFKGYYGR